MMKYEIKKKFDTIAHTTFTYEVVIWVDREILTIFDVDEKPTIEGKDLIVKTKGNCILYFNLFYGDEVIFIEDNPIFII